MFRILLSDRTRLWLPMLVAATSILSGCLADTNPVVQVVPRVVLAPQSPRFQAIDYVPGSNPPEGCMLVIWHRSIADTQLNFKGYFVELYQSHYDTNQRAQAFDGNPIASANIAKTGTHVPDTFCTFCKTALGDYLDTGEYSVIVYGQKEDSTGSLSPDSAEYDGFFDPQPLTDPTNLQAESYSSNQVNLHWTPSPREFDTGFYQYVIYYRDTTKTPFDTGHIVGLVQKHINWNDSEFLATVPGVTPVGESTSEWPYQFWVKSERNDSTFFYLPDSNSVTWAGAERLPRIGNDTGSNTGYLMVRNGQSVYIGSLNGQWDMGIDSTNDGKGQFTVSLPGDGSVTLQAVAPDGVGFLSRTDIDSSLDNVFYSEPLSDKTQSFSKTSITVTPDMATSGGVIVYLMMNDDTRPRLGHQYARIFIHTQVNSSGSFINPNTGGVDLKASFQPALTNDESQHLPYY